MKIKKIIFFSLLVGFTTSCAGQNKISSIKENRLVKADQIQYSVNKDLGGATIENTTNKLDNVKQSSPNLPININLNYYRKIDIPQLTKICAENISISQLEELISAKNTALLITIRSDIKGNILEVGFFTGKNSILTINQIEKIETAIKKSVLITIRPDAEEFLKGSNYIISNPSIFFTDILDLKKKL